VRFARIAGGNKLRIVHVDLTPALDSKGQEMATDYDAPRQKESDDVVDESLEQLAGRRNDAATAVLDVDDGEELEDFELPGADLSGEEFTVRVVPKQRDEFTCSSCFLVQHSHRLARQVGDRMICTDCA
jgi:hypothetical protein